MPRIDVLTPGDPLRTDAGAVGFCTTLLVEGDRRTLVDVGHVGRRLVLVEALERRGLQPGDIDTIVLTHAHWDHAQNLDAFPEAEVLIHPLERRYAHAPHENDWATPAWTGAMLETHSRLREADEGHEIEPGVRVLHTPGHSPGCLSLLVDTNDGTAAVAGDVLHFASVALTRRSPLVFWNEGDATRSIDRILEVADIIYPGHDRPFRVVGGDRIEYERERDLGIGGIDPSEVRFLTEALPPRVMPGIEDQRIEALAP